jgi:hypothetical protein
MYPTLACFEKSLLHPYTLVLYTAAPEWQAKDLALAVQRSINSSIRF